MRFGMKFLIEFLAKRREEDRKLATEKYWQVTNPVTGDTEVQRIPNYNLPECDACFVTATPRSCSEKPGAGCTAG